jgi:acetyltransferase
VPGLIGELAAKGTRAAVVITAGVRAALQQSMLDAARPTCFRIQGPNCLGLMIPGIGLNASFSHCAPLAGKLAFVSQSGALITAVIDWAAARNIGFSHVVSVGDMADADFGDPLSRR